MNEVSGFMIAAQCVMLLGLFILAVGYIKAKYPSSATAQFVIKAGDDIRAVSDHVMTEAEPLIQRAEIGVGNELSKMLGSIETRLLDTSGEDALIAEAQQYLARVTAEVQAKVDAANNAKAAKLSATQAHIATLQAVVAAPATGS